MIPDQWQWPHSQTSEICPICGQEVEADGTDDARDNMDFCEECQRFICTDCYMAIDRLCAECLITEETQV